MSYVCDIRLKWVLYVIATDPGTITMIQRVGFSFWKPGSFHSCCEKWQTRDDDDCEWIAEMLLLCRTYVPYFSLHVDLLGDNLDVRTWRKVSSMQSPNLFNQNIWRNGYLISTLRVSPGMRWRILNFLGRKKIEPLLEKWLFFGPKSFWQSPNPTLLGVELVGTLEYALISRFRSSTIICRAHHGVAGRCTAAQWQIQDNY